MPALITTNSPPVASPALGGTYRDIQVIVIDDGSVDNTAAIRQELSQRDGRVRLLRRPNGGVSAALNSAIELARGTYIAGLTRTTSGTLEA